MTLKFPSDIEEFIEERVLAGDYASAQDVVCAGLRLLKARGEQQSDDFLPSEWDQLLAEAEGGNAIPLDDAIAKRRIARVRAIHKA